MRLRVAKGAHEIVTMPQEGGRGGATATMGQHVGKENERPDADFDVGKRAVAVPTGVVFGTSSAMEASTPQDARKFKDVISNAESNVARLAEVMDSASAESIEKNVRRRTIVKKKRCCSRAARNGGKI